MNIYWYVQAELQAFFTYVSDGDKRSNTHTRSFYLLTYLLTHSLPEAESFLRR